MNKLSFLATAIIAATPTLSARGIAPVGIDSLTFNRHGDFMVVDMNVDLKPVEIQNNRAQIFTPMIVSEEGDTVFLPSVGVYGRQRYINYLRNDRHSLSDESETSFKSSERPQAYDYMASVPFQPWMDNSQLIIRRRLFGCANCLIDEKFDLVSTNYPINPPQPQIKYFKAENIEEIVDSLEGAAYIDFIVDQTNIEPNYRRNPRELLKIQASIDTVLNDKDVTITNVWLKGFASPESPYSHNTELAIGRTKALKEHIRQLYNFTPEIITTDYEPEDWAGLRKLVEASNIDHKTEILKLIDSDMKPDPKETLIKKRYPQEYKFMKENFYPALRHTDYRIKYKVNRFDSVDKIREVMRTRPNRLTLRDFYLLAETYLPGTDEFNEVYETAARMYPNDPVANVNAANAALTRKDYITADKYLQKAGDSKEAQYARAALLFSKGDLEDAEQILQSLLPMPQAQSLLDQITGIRTREATKFTTVNLE